MIFSDSKMDSGESAGGGLPPGQPSRGRCIVGPVSREHDMIAAAELRTHVLIVTGLLAFAATGAQAAVDISSKPTKNMNCSAGVCTPTAKKANLNVDDLTGMLANGQIKVTTGRFALDIYVKAPFSWASASRLTLDAFGSIRFAAQVTVAGIGAVTLVTNDGGSGGELNFIEDGGSLTFWDVNSNLTINEHFYRLEPDIKGLAADIAAAPRGFYALANDYDAGVDGSYKKSVVGTPLDGAFTGLGHTIGNVTIRRGWHCVGLFSQLNAGGTISGVELANAAVALDAQPHRESRIASGLQLRPDFRREIRRNRRWFCGWILEPGRWSCRRKLSNGNSRKFKFVRNGFRGQQLPHPRRRSRRLELRWRNPTVARHWRRPCGGCGYR
jgi:hypothetical protein